ncbi:MAG: toxin-antitoxin system HicB family antitoxin [Planctomycetes bacterium]|nr:toxin-antitoxin system HicB family antitoxin [Planctomycetota bacterium]
MKGFVVELPAELQAEVVRRASDKLSSQSAWVADAVREKLAACDQLEYLEARAARGSREAYERVLAKVPAVEPVSGDDRNSSGLTNG